MLQEPKHVKRYVIYKKKKMAKVIFCAYHSLTVYPFEYSAFALTILICPLVFLD